MQRSYQWMNAKAEQDKKPLYILGQSIGAALSVIAIAGIEDQPDCVVLDSGFASFKDMARISFQRSWLSWSFAYPASWLLPAEFEPLDYASKVKSPVLQMHSKADQVVPFEQGKKLNSYLPTVTWLETTGPHISSFKDLKNRSNVLAFWEQGCSEEGEGQ
jgi:fermentation-respiration switch protein FrsA (DUF1100 family)